MHFLTKYFTFLDVGTFLTGMMKEAFQAYLADKNRLFEKHFRLLKQKIKDDDVHELRVCIKKLRAAYYFLETQKILKSRDARYKHEMRHVYKASGNYRDMGVYLNSTKQFENVSSSDFSFLKNHLASMKEKLSFQLASSLSNFDFDNQIEFSGNLLLKINGYQSKKIRNGLEKHLNKLRKQSEKMLITKETQWHELRKIVKNIYYLYPVAVQKVDNQFMEFIKTVTDKLGYWQDCQAFSDYLTSYVIYHEVFEFENRLLINDLVSWLKSQSKAQLKGLKKGLRMELDTIQKIGISKD